MLKLLRSNLRPGKSCTLPENFNSFQKHWVKCKTSFSRLPKTHTCILLYDLYM